MARFGRMGVSNETGRLPNETRPETVQHPQADPTSSRTLNGLLDRLVERDGQRLLLADSQARAAWCSRSPKSYSRAEAQDAVARLGGSLRGAGLPAGASVAICLSGGPEASLALLGTLSAGLTPCLIPLDLDEAHLLEALEATDARAVVTQAQAGDLRPASMVRGLAARLFRLRYVMSFGPDVPDGVIDLDRLDPREAGAGWKGGRQAQDEAAPPETGIVTLNRTGGCEPIFRTVPALLAAAEALTPFNVRAGGRVMTYLVPDDLKALCTGLVPCLLTGAVLEHAMLDPDFVVAGDDVPSHTVLPGWCEPTVSALQSGMSARTWVYVSDAPVPPRRLPEAGHGHEVVDVVSFGERAILAAARGEGGSAPLQRPHPGRLQRRIEARRDRPEWRWTEQGSLSVRGPAAASAPFDRRMALPLPESDLDGSEWIDCGRLFTIPTATP